MRRRLACAFGLIDGAARVASEAPGLVNFWPRTPLVKGVRGVPQNGEVPPFSSPPFKQRFAERPQRNGGGRRAVLWADTVTNYFHAPVGGAAPGALGDAGYHVVVPPLRLRRGRPPYYHGMLGRPPRYAPPL